MNFCLLSMFLHAPFHQAQVNAQVSVNLHEQSRIHSLIQIPIIIPDSSTKPLPSKAAYSRAFHCLPAPQAMPVLHTGAGGHDQPEDLCVHTRAQTSRNLGEETAVPRLPFGIGVIPASHQSRVNSESKDRNFYFSRSRARMINIIKRGTTPLEVIRK